MLATARSPEQGAFGLTTMEHAYGGNVIDPRPDSAIAIGSDGKPRRIPKLAVRNKVADIGNANEQAAVPPLDASSDHGDSTPSSSRSSHRSAQRLPPGRSLGDETVNTRRWSGNQSFNGAVSKTNFTSQPSKKRKGAGMLGFLTLKEPSTSALEEFAASEKEKARQKGSSTTATGLGVSSQKLPEFVPKVNSRWDGLPESAKRKSKSRDNRDSLSSSGSRQTNWTAKSSRSGESQATKRTFGSLTSRPCPSRDAVQPMAWPSVEGRDSSSQGSTRQAPALALVPETEPIALDRNSEPVEMTDDNKPQTFLRDSSAEPEEQNFLPQPEAWLSPPELEGDDILHLQELDARATSPHTPPADGSETTPVLVGIHYPELDPHMHEIVDDLDAALPDDTKPEIVARKPSRPGSFRRAINFSRPHNRMSGLPSLQLPTWQSDRIAAGWSSQVEDILLTPTLRGSSGRIDPFLTDTFASHSRETGHIPRRVASTIVKDGQLDVSQLQQADVVAMSDVFPITPEEARERNRHLLFRPEEPTRSTSDTSVNTTVCDPGEPLVRSNSDSSLAASMAPSELSERWQLSPKERLGLGGRMRRSDVLPWEMVEDRADTPVSPFSESKRKRLSLRLTTRR